MRFALLLSYDGTHFRGWQVQKNARTVQGELEGAAEKLFGCKTKVAGSGRTDAGVHARAEKRGCARRIRLHARGKEKDVRLYGVFRALRIAAVRSVRRAAQRKARPR